MPPLSADEVRTALEERLTEWTLEGDAIRRELRFKGFAAAVAFVDRLVEPANAARHHPDLEVGYGRVVVRLTTHDQGGVTEADLSLAETIDGLVNTPSD